ncbi:phospholipase A2 inhibitor gamma subunit B-like [Hyperolius riggenbachi]|uniref:phospholipase A2 inhibitor gamma subunit B-like n=1 Tax=Hyperolius riggenbachi TaxID=752182 RepID=UPI0035A27897
MSGSASTFGGRMKVATGHCDTDNCSPILPNMPTDSSVLNGLACPSCVSGDSTLCYSQDTQQCTGSEDMCVLISTRVAGGPKQSTAFRGCSSKNICDFGSQTYLLNGIATDFNFFCSGKGAGSRSP